MKNKKAFTLIELIAVLVILAIIALIVTPLVMNIVNKARESANKRSVDGYGKSVELAIATYLLDNGDYPTDLNNLKVEYSGNEVNCGVKVLNEDGSIFLTECIVAGMEVKDAKTDDGWYHYGKRASSDSDINTKYQVYSIGDIVTYNGMNFYVIEASDENSDRVTMLKAEPLTVNEVNTYGVGHINRYTYDSVGTAYDKNGYGGMVYYTSETCGYPNGQSGSWVDTGCTTDYAQSEVKYVVDAWATDKLNASDLTEDNLGYKTRLLTFEDLTNNLGYEREGGATYIDLNTENTPSWVYNNNYWYWTISTYDDSKSGVWSVYNDSNPNGNGIGSGAVSYDFGTVRPVITLLKSAIETN